MIPRNLTTPAAIIFLPLFLGLSGCALALIGVGAGIGALTYVNGEAVKTYAAEYDEAVQASLATLKSLKIPIKDKTVDELETTIRAKRADGTPVTVEVVRVDRRLTEIGVRTGTLGVWDLAVSRQIHDFIGKRLASEPGGAERAAKHPSAKKGQQGAGTKANQSIESPDRVIYFDQDSNDFADKELEKLNRVAEIILQNPQAAVTIHGYSDATDNPDYNALVAESRSNAVKVYLIGKGIPPKSLTVVNHASDNSRAESNRLTSRVEIEINAF